MCRHWQDSYIWKHPGISMTPAINSAKRAGIKFHVHEYDHDPAAESYGAEAAAKLGVDSGRVFKTLVIALGNRDLAVAVLPVAAKLDLKRFAKAMGTKKALMADKGVAERTTGYVLGGVSPVGQKKKLRTVIDVSASRFDTMYVSAGRRGLEIELSPLGLCRLTDAEFGAVSK